MAFKKKGTIQGDQFKVTGATVTINSQSIIVNQRDADGMVTDCKGTVTNPTDGGAGYAVGCKYVQTDGSAGTIVYWNEGTTSSCDFNVMETAASGVTAVVAGAGLTGGATSGSATLDVVNTDGNIVVGADTVDLAPSLTLTKEGSRTVKVGASTTADTVGGSLTTAGGDGFGTGAGGAGTLKGGLGGATGAGGVGAVLGGAGGATSGDGGDAIVTGGAATANNDDGGDVILTGGAAHGTGVSGKIMNRSLQSVAQGAPTAKTTSATLTAAEVLAQIITVNQGAAGTSAQQLPLATDLDTALPGFAAGDAFDFSVINTSTVDAEDASVTTNTGWTLVGSMDIHAYSAAGSLNSSARFRARKTGAGAWTLYRIA